MSNAFSLEDLDAAVEQQFAPLKFTAGGEEFTLRNVLRLSSGERDTVMESVTVLEGASSGDVDVETATTAIETVLKSITADGKGQKLLTALGGDLMRYQILFRKWAEATQVGEAGNSPA